MIAREPPSLSLFIRPCWLHAGMGAGNGTGDKETLAEVATRDVPGNAGSTPAASRVSHGKAKAVRLKTGIDRIDRRQ